jgi:tetratricopeptide (TPR) repeat protein
LADDLPSAGEVKRRFAAATLVALAFVAGCDRGPAAPAGSEAGSPRATAATKGAPAAELAAASFVGSEACTACHEAEAAAWRTSQHARAMQHATDATVLGDFRDARFRYAGVETRFFRRDGKFWVRTDGADGKLADFEIRYTFGVEPLQQYLVEFPDGRLQALSIAWDTRPKAQGGQRWFHLYPDQRVDHRDELHWTRGAQNWNFMCADCHSTDVRKNYDAAADTFRTAYSEISVGCEACHGPGSVHVVLARQRPADAAAGLTVRFHERRGVAWVPDAATGTPRRSTPRATDVELQVCAQCHARRSQVAEGYRAGEPFLDHYRPALLDDGLYHVDGQQRDEVFTWGSFLQSRMFHAGVTCGDCHEPHGGKLRAEGNAVCAQCHLPQKYDTSAHHRHGGGNEPTTAPQAGATTPAVAARGVPGRTASRAAAGDGTRCVDCHMPATTYMIVDPRRDHSFRVPRPDLSVTLGTPNACTGCHSDRDAPWAAAALQAWNGRQPAGFQRWAEAFDADRRRSADAPRLLGAVAIDATNPPIARATALQSLGEWPVRGSVDAARASLADPDPLVRRGAISALAPLPPPPRLDLLAPLLRDPVLTVRIDAVERLADALPAMSPEQRTTFESAAAEYEAVQRYNADRPEARAALGNFRARQGRLAEAQTDLESALALDPTFVPAWANLADLQRAQGRDDEAERVLREGLRRAGDHAALRHALGLTLVRKQQLPAALPELAAATRLAPEDARYAYVHAVALHSAGREAPALRELDRALARHPDDRELLMAATTYGGAKSGEKYARRLAERYRGDPAVAQFLVEWSGQGAPPR